MKKNLLTRFILCFLFLAFTVLILLNTIGVSYTKKTLLQNKKSLLYEEAQLIAKEQLANYYTNNISPRDLNSQLKTIDTFLEIQIWIVNTDGAIICNTRNPNGYTTSNIYDYDSNFFRETYYDYTYYPDLMSEPMLY